MARNSHLVLAFFESEAVADKAAADLERWAEKRKKKDKKNRIDLEAVGVLVKDEHGDVKTHKLGPSEGSKGIGIGAVLGLIVAGPIGGIALVEGVAVGGASGGLVGSFFHRGLDLTDGDVTRIAQRLDSGHAALGVLVPRKQAPAVAGQLAMAGGESEAHEVSKDAIKAAKKAVTSTGETA
jgi:uncharacterized membrane protein